MWIKYFCGLSDGQTTIEEVEHLVLSAPVIDAEEVQRIRPAMKTFDYLLKCIPLEPQDWFDYVVGHYVTSCSSQEAVVTLPIFTKSLWKLSFELHTDVLNDEHIQALYVYFVGHHRQCRKYHATMLSSFNDEVECPTDTYVDVGFEVLDLAIAFAKYQLPYENIRKMNEVAEKVKVLGRFLRETHKPLATFGVSTQALRSGMFSESELEKVLMNLVQKQLAHAASNASMPAFAMPSLQQPSLVSSLKQGSSSTSSTPPNSPPRTSKNIDSKIHPETNIKVSPTKPLRKRSMFQSMVEIIESVSLPFSSSSSSSTSSLSPGRPSSLPNSTYAGSHPGALSLSTRSTSLSLLSSSDAYTAASDNAIYVDTTDSDSVCSNLQKASSPQKSTSSHHINKARHSSHNLSNHGLIRGNHHNKRDKGAHSMATSVPTSPSSFVVNGSVSTMSSTNVSSTSNASSVIPQQGGPKAAMLAPTTPTSKLACAKQQDHQSQDDDGDKPKRKPHRRYSALLLTPLPAVVFMDRVDSQRALQLDQTVLWDQDIEVVEV